MSTLLCCCNGKPLEGARLLFLLWETVGFSLIKLINQQKLEIDFCTFSVSGTIICHLPLVLYQLFLQWKREASNQIKLVHLQYIQCLLKGPLCCKVKQTETSYLKCSLIIWDLFYCHEWQNVNLMKVALSGKRWLSLKTVTVTVKILIRYVQLVCVLICSLLLKY